jgi:hypothetical protein
MLRHVGPLAVILFSLAAVYLLSSGPVLCFVCSRAELDSTAVEMLYAPLFLAADASPFAERVIVGWVNFWAFLMAPEAA